jgi:hypothetical protein
MSDEGPQVFMEVRPSGDGYYAKALIEGAPDLQPRTYVGVHATRDEAVHEAAGWALRWLRRLQARARHSEVSRGLP